MAIGILALAIGALFIAISNAGIRDVEPAVRKERPVRYPFPEEI